MANLPISQLPETSSLESTDVIAVVNSGTTKKITIQDLSDIVLSTASSGTIGEAENGVEVVNNKVRLGGSLIVDTEIDQLGKNFTLLNGNFISKGGSSYDNYPDLSSYYGSMMLWNPKYATFRAGTVRGSIWEENFSLYGSAVLGENNEASNYGTFAAGKDNKATGQYASVLGLLNTSSGNQAFSIGYNNNALGDNSLSTGFQTISAGFSSAALGHSSQAKGYNSIAGGANSIAAGSNSFALGESAKTGDTAAAPNSTSEGANSMAIGNNVHAKANASYAFGSSSVAHRPLAVAIGNTSNAYSEASFAYGCESQAGQADGNGKLAWAVGHSVKALSNNSFAFGLSAKVGIDENDVLINSDGSFAFGNNAIALKNHSLAFGAGVKAHGNHAFAMGQQAKALNSHALSFGMVTEAWGNESFAQGFLSKAYGNQSIALGCQSVAGTFTDGTEEGYENHIGQAAIAIGDNAMATKDYSAAFGSFIIADEDNSMVIGRGIGGENVLAVPMVNGIQNSLMVGFNSNIPTLFVGASDGTNTTGKVGVGTSSPTAKLEVAGDFKLESGTSVNEITTTIDTVNPSDDKLVTEKAIQSYINSNGGGTSTESGTSFTRTVVGHSFSVGDLAYYDGTTYDKAIADAGAVNNDSYAIFVIKKVDGNEVTFGTSGAIVELTLGFTGAPILYLSDTVAGAAIETKPSTIPYQQIGFYADGILHFNPIPVHLEGEGNATNSADSLYLNFALNGETQHSSKALGKTADSNKSTTFGGNNVYPNGQIDPYVIHEDGTVKSLQVAFAKAGIQLLSGDVMDDVVSVRLNMFRVFNDSREMIGSFDVPVDKTLISTNGGLGVIGVQSLTLPQTKANPSDPDTPYNVPLTATVSQGDLIGLEFESGLENTSIITSISRLEVSMKIELN